MVSDCARNGCQEPFGGPDINCESALDQVSSTLGRASLGGTHFANFGVSQSVRHSGGSPALSRASWKCSEGDLTRCHGPTVGLEPILASSGREAS